MHTFRYCTPQARMSASCQIFYLTSCMATWTPNEQPKVAKETSYSTYPKRFEGDIDIRTSRHAPCVRVSQCMMDLHHCTLLATTLWTPVPPGLMEKKPAIDMVPLKLQTYTRIHMTMTRGDVDML